MKKRLTGILAFIVSMTMAASMLTACGGAKKDNSNNGSTAATEQKEKSPEEQAKETVKKYMDASLKADFDAASKYAEGQVKDAFSDVDDMKKEFGSAFKRMGMELSDDKSNELLDEIISGVVAELSYEIGDVELADDGESAKVAMKITGPDFDNFEPDVEKLSETLNDSLGFDISDPEEMIKGYMKKTGLTEDELKEKFKSQDDFQKAFLSEFSGEIVDGLKDWVLDAIKGAKKIDKDSTYTVEKQEDGSWKITSVKE